MTTQILDLERLQFAMTVATNEDWTDAWAYLDASGNPVSLAGITLNFMVRLTASSPYAPIIASTAPTVDGLPVNGAVITGGASGNVVALAIPAATMRGVAPGSYVFEMQAVGDGLMATIGYGPLTVLQGVVR